MHCTQKCSKVMQKYTTFQLTTQTLTWDWRLPIPASLNFNFNARPKLNLRYEMRYLLYDSTDRLGTRHIRHDGFPCDISTTYSITATHGVHMEARWKIHHPRRHRSRAMHWQTSWHGPRQVTEVKAVARIVNQRFQHTTWKADIICRALWFQDVSKMSIRRNILNMSRMFDVPLHHIKFPVTR